MEHYGSNNNSNISAGTPFSSLPSIAPQQLQQSNSSLPPHTLPPLQAHHGGIPMGTMYTQPLTAPHTPSTSAPNTPGSVGNGGYSQMGGHGAPRGYQMPGNPYQQPMQSYNPTSHMMSQPPPTNAHQQNLAPAPTPRALMPIRPMSTASPLHAQHGLPGQMQTGMPSPYGQQAMAADSETPTHVVGSQGRRGILPSAPGRPAVAPTGTGTTKNTVAPTKDADGKYPCPHCTKTYLHAKHLKRHLLRHTGDRPYMCVLCRDTFSRSDILKRHFQKCSIRRGNPTGASHLSHAQAHLKKNNNNGGNNNAGSSNNSNGTPGGVKAEDDSMRSMNGLSSMPSDTPGNHVFGVMPLNDGTSGLPDDQSSQSHLSRTNSLKRMSTGGPQERSGLPPSSHNSSNRGSFDHSYNGNPSVAAPSNLNPHLAAYHMTNAQSGSNFMQPYDYQHQSNVAASNSNHTNAASIGTHPNSVMPSMTGGRGGMMYGNAVNGQHSGNDWNQSFFQPGAHGFLSSLNPNLSHSQVPPIMTIKSDQPYASTEAPHSRRCRMPNPNHDDRSRSTAVDLLTIPSAADPQHPVMARIQEYCSHIELALDSHGHDLRRYLSAVTVKQCFANFEHFQAHFPMLHLPTFDASKAYGGLLLAMTCVGAVYSDCLAADRVRELMELAKLAVERDAFHLFPVSSYPSTHIDAHVRTSRCTDKQLENIQALVLLYSLFVWHGSPIQRERARRKFPAVVKLVQDAGLHEVLTSPQSFSILHQPNVVTEHVSSAIFNWTAWVEQEKRSRTFFVVFLMDCAMTLYFNLKPQLQSLEIGLPLPCDDAAWEANTAQACADALGLRGKDMAHGVNQEGSRLAKQPEMHTVMHSLFYHALSNATTPTNSYSKFVLVHAIHVQLWKTLKSQSMLAGQMTPDHSNSNSPRLQNDGRPRTFDEEKNDFTSNIASHSLSIQEEADQSPIYSLSAINAALESWKRAWDADMLAQYPPNVTSSTRTGFCRDGLHFYYLAKFLLQNRVDLRMAPDQRFVHMIAYLKRVKHWVVSDSAERGEGLGSVGDIDTNYGVRDLTLDMSQFFRPLHPSFSSVSTAHIQPLT